ncbi:DNA-processing protein DprA [Nesterenkonia lacusekhoensis]|uniref:DNA processing protein n=1 Tax=Nesterenkonia lacusekhoensis TaxID=150832 RepID=A0ABS4T0E1_9MICC|nr:DNA-processing protein DprA [Nesterenkonia lacusekhoensis]MBP2317922.1 DNA processing protein [Nesterenkonia lacusekhoensis]
MNRQPISTGTHEHGHDEGISAVDTQEHLRQVRAELSRIIEPGDLLAGVVIDHMGCFEAHALIRSGESAPQRLVQSVTEAAEAAGLSGRQRDLREALVRWRTRQDQAAGARDLATLRRLGGGILVPEDPHWPTGLRDLGPAQPLALWWRRDRSSHPVEALPELHRTVAVVGSREITDYGSRVTAEICETLAERQMCLLSGGAYGVDAAVHRAALRVWERRSDHPDAEEHSLIPTVAVLAGGLDRLYPAGNDSLLRAAAQAGLLLSELAPGSSPSKHRFLQRNRIIAALASVTVVPEARWRSGAQNTAHHALSLGRPVGAVPGSVYSPLSAGCHRLLRETPTEMVRDAADVAELIASGTASPVSAPQPRQQMLALPTGEGASAQKHRTETSRPEDSLGEADRLLLDALPKRRLSPPGKLSEVAGLPMPQVLGGLSRLQRRGLARSVNGQWGKTLTRPSS